MSVKIIALYLPQYHAIPENDSWWGKGFTEWTNVRNAKPVFQWQVQPKVPLNNNYYNLLDKETVEWQTKLANQYGIYGFCYFHYYFKGKKLLEKPAENLLKWKDINQRFCFFWANDSWCRTWSAAKAGTTWSAKDEKIMPDDNGMLMEQTYGNSADWEEHFRYLNEFFQDDRYIKVNNKPMFYIYNLSKIPCAKEMFSLWNRLAKENGFNGIHIVSVNEPNDNNIPQVEAIAHYGFHKASRSKMIGVLSKIKNKLKRHAASSLGIQKLNKDVWSYDKMWNLILSVKPYGNIQNYPGGFVNYDDTPRKGFNGTVMKGVTPKLFEKYLRKQIIRAKEVFHSEYLLLDAWNEWGEGNYLEPDEQWGYEYLEALQKALR